MPHSNFSRSILRFFSGLILFLTVSGSLADQARVTANDGKMAPDMARILQSGQLKVAMIHDETPPFIQSDENNKLSGIDVDIIFDIADKLGVKAILDRSAKTYDDVVKKVYEGNADIGISALSDTLYRAKQVRFTRPYWSLRQAFLVNRLKLQTSKNFREHDDIRLLLNKTGVLIGAIEGSAYVQFAKSDYPLAKVVPYHNLTQGIADTKTGKLMAFFYDEVEVINWNKKHPEDTLHLRSIFLAGSKDTLAIAVPWQNEHLLSWLNLYIDKSKADFFEELQNRYISSQ